MKKISLYIFICLFFSFGCKDDYDKSTNLYPSLVSRYLAVTPSTLSFAAKDNTSRMLNIQTLETPWCIDNGVDWIRVSSLFGNASQTVEVNVTEHQSADVARTGVFYVKSDISDWQYSMPISVVQAAVQPYITPVKTQVVFTGAASAEDVLVESNCTWSASSSDDWLTVTVLDQKIQIVAAANVSDAYRSAVVSLTYNGTQNVSSTVTVKQAPASIKATTETLTLDNGAGTVEISLTAETEWDASTSESWIEVSPTSGVVGTTMMTVSVTPNPSLSERVGFIILRIGEHEKLQIPVRQRGIYVDVQYSLTTFAASGQSQTLSIQSNTSWTIQNCPEWITLSQGYGFGNAVVTITASDNESCNARVAVINVTSEGMSIENRLEITQEGKVFDLSATTLAFSDKSGTQTLNIEADGPWSASSGDSWISITPTAASGTSSATISVSENTSNAERSGIITFAMVDKTLQVAVTQQGKYLTIENCASIYPSTGGTIELTITTNDTWSAYVADGLSWLSLNKTTGSETAKLQVSVADNPSVNQRSGNIVIETPHQQNVQVQITQAARYLTIDHQSILFYSKGGTSEAVTVSTDGTYTITAQDSWISIHQTANTFTVTASENTSNDVRSGVIVIALSNLLEGAYSISLPVNQLNQGGAFLRNDFNSDRNYDFSTSAQTTLNIMSFGVDKNYDGNITRGTTLEISGIKSDTNLDVYGLQGLSVSQNGFNSDKNLDNTSTTVGSISKSTFNADTTLQ